MKHHQLIAGAILAAQLASLVAFANDADPCHTALEPQAPKPSLFSTLFAKRKASNLPSAVPKNSSSSSSPTTSTTSTSGGGFTLWSSSRTPEEIAREKKRDAEHQAWVQEQKVLKRARADKMLRQIQLLLADQSRPEFVRSLKDNLHAAWLVAASREFPTVGVAVSHAGAQLTPTAIEAYQAAVSKAAADGKLVIYDADSAAAEIIAQAAGDFGIGVTAGEASPSSRVVSIGNPYLRFHVFRKAGTFIGSSDSLIAHGMDVDSNSVQWVGDDLPRREWLGMKSVVTPAGYLEQSSSFGSYHDTPANFRYTPSAHSGFPIRMDDLFKDPMFSRMSADKLEDLVRAADGLVEGYAEIDGRDATPNPRGSVILGAGQAISKYIDRVYDITYALAKLGIPVTTGGAGGFMEIANAAAWDAGGDSVGIPMGGKLTIAGEEKAAKSVQTRTIEAYGYETRIPLLLADRPIVGFAPGRKGTYQELAVLMTALNDAKSGHQIVFFISASYYGQFVEALHKSPLPQSFLRRLRVVESPDQVESIVAALQAEPGTNPARLLGRAPVAPRSTTRSLPKPKVFSGSGSSGGSFGTGSGSIFSSGSSDGPPPFTPKKKKPYDPSDKGLVQRVTDRLFKSLFGDFEL